MKVLITAATSAGAHKLKNKLNSEDVLLGDYKDLPDFMLRNMGMIKLPNPASASYSHEMLTLCLDKEIEAAYILTVEEITLLNESIQLFKEYNIDIIDGRNEI